MSQIFCLVATGPDKEKPWEAIMAISYNKSFLESQKRKCEQSFQKSFCSFSIMENTPICKIKLIDSEENYIEHPYSFMCKKNNSNDQPLYGITFEYNDQSFQILLDIGDNTIDVIDAIIEEEVSSKPIMLDTLYLESIMNDAA